MSGFESDDSSAAFDDPEGFGPGLYQPDEYEKD